MSLLHTLLIKKVYLCKQITESMKEEQYKLLVSQIASLIDGEGDMIAVMSNVAAAIVNALMYGIRGVRS